MNDASMKLMYWMSGIDFDLLARVDNPSRGVRARPWRVWIAVAAALLVLALLLSTALIGYQTDAYVQENYEHYDGTVLHMMDIMLTQDENAFTQMLGESGTEKLHALFVALHKILYPDEDIRFYDLPVQPLAFYHYEDSIAIGGWGWSKEACRLWIPEESDGLPVNWILSRGFADTNNLEVAKIPGSIKGMDFSAFADCPDLEKVIMEYGVEVIGSGAFANCSALTEVVLPNSLKELSYMVFTGCTSLTEITYMGTMDEWEAFYKHEDWYLGSSIKVVHCTDGDIAVGE